MKKVKMLVIGVLLGTSFAAGQMFAPSASGFEPGSKEDPVITESFLKAKVEDLNKEISSLKESVKSLQSKVDKLSAGGSTGGSTGGSSSNSNTSIGTAVVNTASLNVRKGAGTSHPKVGSLTKGNKVTVLKKSGSWYQIKYNNITGWVSGDYLTMSGGSSSGSSTTKKYAVVTVAALNVRKGAGTSHAKVGSLSKNTKVEVLKTSGSWKQIKSGKITGWVSGEYLKSV